MPPKESFLLVPLAVLTWDFVINFKKNINLTALGLGCSMQDLCYILWDLSLWPMDSLVVACGLQGLRGSVAWGLSRPFPDPGARAQLMWLMGLAAPQHVGSFWTRDQTFPPALAGRHSTTGPPGKSQMVNFEFIGPRVLLTHLGETDCQSHP